MLECKTYRYFDHVGVKGMGVAYRDDAELESWMAKDPITAFEAQLAALGVLSTEAAAEVHAQVLEEVAAAIRFAEDSPLPDPSALMEDVYA